MNLEKTIERGESMLWVMGIMKLVLVAFFFASFILVKDAPAESVDHKACTGENLLVKLDNEDPLGFRKVLEEAYATPNADSIFWKLEKEGEKPSWLYGTMHLSDPQIATIPEDAKAAILKSDAIIIESIEALDAQATAKANIFNLSTFLTQGTLRDYVMDNLEDELETAVSERGIPMALADRMQPWLISTTVAIPICEFKRKREGLKVLDDALAHFATENGKALRGLETVAEQLSAIASLPIDFHVAALEETLASGQLATDMFVTMKELYKQGRMGLVLPLMKAVMPGSGNSEGAAQFQEALLDKRNQIMFDRSLPILEEGPAFIAVGALHLPGETGLVKLFQDAGYTVTSQR